MLPLSKKQLVMIGAGVIILCTAAAALIFFSRTGRREAVMPEIRKTVSNLGVAQQEETPSAPGIEHNAGAFADGQPFARFAAEDFEAVFPDLPMPGGIEASSTADGQIFVSNNGCNVIIRPVQIAQGTTYRAHIEKTLKDAEQYKPVFNRKDVTDSTAMIDADIPLADATLRNVAYNYLTSKGRSYGIAFVAEKSNYEKACQPYVDEVIKSVKVK